MAELAQVKSYIAYQKSTDKSQDTMASYHSDLRQFAKWFASINKVEMHLHHITPTDLRQYKQYLLDAKRKPQTINRHLLSLKYFLNWGFDTKKIKHRLPLPQTVKQSPSIPKWLNRLQQNQLLRQVERYGSKRDMAIIKVLLNTGLRVRELCSIKWSDVSISDRKGKLRVNAGKGGKYREVPLNQDARNAFIDIGYKTQADSEALVFNGQRGPLSPRGIQLMIKRLNILEGISPHQLRHSFCKNLVDAGVSLEKVSYLAGHERLDTTKLYCQPSFTDLELAVERIGELDTCV